MMTTRKMTGLSVLALTLVVGACDDSTGVESLDDALVLDAAMVASDATIEDVRLWSSAISFGSLPAATAHSRTSGDGHHGRYGSWDGMRSVTFYDADGVEQGTYDERTTAEIHIDHSFAGAIERDGFSAEISRERSMIVSGLEGEETTRTWNGSSTSSLARTGVLDDGTERSHSMEGSTTVTDVVVPIPGSDPRWPLSGTIEKSMVVTKTTADGTETRNVEIVITFDGSQFAVAVVNGESIEIDLAARDGRHPFRRLHRG